MTRVLTLACLLACGHVIAASESSAQAIAFNCQTCHDPEVQAEDQGIPDLSRLSRSQLYKALLDFKYGPSSATLMPRLVRGFSDDELRAIAETLQP